MPPPPPQRPTTAKPRRRSALPKQNSKNQTVTAAHPRAAPTRVLTPVPSGLDCQEEPAREARERTTAPHIISSNQPSNNPPSSARHQRQALQEVAVDVSAADHLADAEVAVELSGAERHVLQVAHHQTALGRL